MKLMSLKSLIICSLSLLALSPSLAQRVAGGAPKPGASFGYENLRAIAKDVKVTSILASTFGDESVNLKKLELTNVDDQGFHYRLETSSKVSSAECAMDITVWNTHASLVSEVQVTGVKIVSGCQATKTAEAKPIEGLLMIATDKQVMKTQGLSFSIEKIELKKSDSDGLHYQLTSETMRAQVCLIDVVAKDGALVSVQINEASAKTDDGECKIVEPPRLDPAITKYKEIFDKMKGDILSRERKYEDDYLSVVRSLSPELRQEIRDYMKKSDPKYHQVFTEKAQEMVDFLAKLPGATNGNAFYLMHVVMGYPTTGGGIAMPTVIGMSYAPLFIVDAAILK